ncbi:uncharacterized protein BCR38DRAFT_493220 [Pseudomassariella vexata]|uniref:UBA domain-containing protein n=1 Tax=Pseudomassariella vexata TaxID=1141098 RepID=A0A1Y2EK78_9PEZI|nr:uncharacterized protein BCR38DRAFT_493220 [Pseudomassariella vexata]ORY71716.1 hypothetical protein BCR38DRAFT_493220 [Pseudomassariella vexata]
MTTTSIPPDEAISQICEFIGLDRNDAIKRLQANNNDPERAIGEYLDDPTDSKNKYRWDESAFGAGRQGEPANPAISFNIHGPDDLVGQTSHLNTSSGAPTRPPSRANNRSPLGSRYIFCMLPSTKLTPLYTGVPANAAQEDADLARALAESAAESGIPPQETGVVDNGANVKYFGPANRNDYEKDQWAMVPTKAQAEATNTEVPPSARKRGVGEPAFLRTSKKHRLGAVVAIFHAIPLARNILLSCGYSARSYGHNTDWWKGQPILKQEQLAAMARGEVVWGGEAHPDFSEELHRLIAFLDGTERSYGSVDCLAETEEIGTNYWGADHEVEDKFFEALKNESQNNPTFEQLMNRLLTDGKVEKIISGEDDDEDQQTKFAFLDAALNPEQYDWITTLYDVIDHLLWDDALSPGHSFPEGARNAFFTNPAEIFTIRFGGPEGLKKPCDIPAVFYVDRYLESRKVQALELQSQINWIKRDGLQGLEQWEKQQMTCKGEQGCAEYEWLEQPHDARECCKKIIETSAYLIDRQQKKAQWRYYEERISQGTTLSMEDLRLIHTWSGPYELNEEEQKRQATLKHMIETSAENLLELEEEQAKAQERKEHCKLALEVLKRRLTCREDEADAEFKENYILPSQPEKYNPNWWNPTHRYALRGVATTPEIAYICTRDKVEATCRDVEERSGSCDQWWRLEYVENHADPVKVDKTDVDTVLLAAGTESNFPILVYASETAMDAEPIPLSDALKMFVRADNRSFQQEIAQAQEQTSEAVPLTLEAIQSVPTDPIRTLPTKRKHSCAGSSVATLGSRSSRDMMDMIFSDEPDPFPDDSTPSTFHQEFADPAPQTNKLGGVVESLANFRTHSESPILRRDGPQTPKRDDSGSKVPEMQERSGGPPPFITRPRQGSQTLNNSHIDMMEIGDEDLEKHEAN